MHIFSPVSRQDSHSCLLSLSFLLLLLVLLSSSAHLGANFRKPYSYLSCSGKKAAAVGEERRFWLKVGRGVSNRGLLLLQSVVFCCQGDLIAWGYTILLGPHLSPPSSWRRFFSLVHNSAREITTNATLAFLNDCLLMLLIFNIFISLKILLIVNCLFHSINYSSRIGTIWCIFLFNPYVTQMIVYFCELIFLWQCQFLWMLRTR